MAEDLPEEGHKILAYRPGYANNGGSQTYHSDELSILLTALTNAEQPSTFMSIIHAIMMLEDLLHKASMFLEF